MILKFIFIFNLFVISLSSKELITPIPLNNNYNLNKALLGKELFFDTRLSSNNTISCASCHKLLEGGDDNLPISFGINKKAGTRNSPTIFNSRYNVWQFWDTRAVDLKEQAKGPIHNPVEMGSNFPEVISKLKKDNNYVKKFKKLYKLGITADSITDAISEFEKTLTTPNSRFDKYLRGDKRALSLDEINGYKVFKNYGCISCHNGVNIGGNLIQKIGLMEKYDTDDLGVYNITKKEEDKYYFKVPSLRNIELTAPYFHDGKVTTLEEAVDIMIKYQVGFPLKDEDKSNLIKYLKTLTGELPKSIKSNK